MNEATREESIIPTELSASFPGESPVNVELLHLDRAGGRGAFDSDTATGMMPVAHRVAGVLASRRS